MNYKFKIGQRVAVKFNCKWTGGIVEAIQRRGLNKVFYFIKIEGAKHLKKVTEDDIW